MYIGSAWEFLKNQFFLFHTVKKIQNWPYFEKIMQISSNNPLYSKNMNFFPFFATNQGLWCMIS